jgi:cell division septation protein DedD
VSAQNPLIHDLGRIAHAAPRLSWCVVLASLALVVPAVSGTCDPLVRSAQAAQKAGDTAQAASTYRDWLHANPGAPGSATVFSAYFATETDLSALLAESSAFLVSAKGCAGSGQQFRRIARLFDLAGLVEESRDAYLDAWSEDSSPDALVAAAFLSLEMNDTAAMAKILTESSGTPAEALAAALSAGQGYEGLSALASQSGNPDLALKARWVLSRLALARGDAASSAAELHSLADQFGGSPEAVLASGRPGSPAGSLVVLAESAYTVLEDALPPAAPDSSGVPAAPGVPDPTDAAVPPSAASSIGDASPLDPQAPDQPKASYAVQAGSFQFKENADDLSAELSKKGFSATIVHDLFQGKDRFRVLAGATLVLDQAKAVLGRLAGAGYSGFLIAQP